VRLPKGVFAPYADIPTNLLFFERSGPTKDIWYYEHPLPEGRKSYVKTYPLRFEEFEPLHKWWGKREENDHAWKVPVGDVLKYDKDSNLVSANLDIKNPSRKKELEHLPPNELADGILKKEQRIIDIVKEIKEALT
jgi:type I restriction enzyme M protein